LVGVFAVIAAVGFIGDGPLAQPDYIWTNWIVQIALLILALRFTDWYPDVAVAPAEIAGGTRTDPRRRASHCFARWQPASSRWESRSFRSAARRGGSAWL
jgi:hypothetical protein